MDDEISALDSQFHSEMDNLKKLRVPYSDIYSMVSTYDTIDIETLGPTFRRAASESNEWIEVAKAAVLGLEWEARKISITGEQEMAELETALNRFQPNIDMMMELRDKIMPRLETLEANRTTQNSVDASGVPLFSVAELQYTMREVDDSWVSLKDMLEEVRGLLTNATRRRELLTHMEEVLAEIESIDKFQEDILHGTTETEKPSSEPTETPSSPPFPASSPALPDTPVSGGEHAAAQGKQRHSDALAEVDTRIQTLTTKIEALTVQIDAHPSSDTNKEELNGQYRQLLDLWADVKTRRETIGEELKERRWLTVFEQVSGQVGSMMESLERAIVHCKGLVDQIKTMIKEKEVPTAPIDREHLYTIFKSFESKHKYYAPAVQKMLNMLENGIEKSAKNPEIIERHRAMKEHWQHLKADLDSVELDLDRIEEMLNILDDSIPAHAPTLPAQLPEKPIFAMRRATTAVEMKSPEPPALFQPPESSSQAQRGRHPLPPSAISRSGVVSTPELTAKPRDKSPMNTLDRRRPWSPAPSVTQSVSSLSSMLSLPGATTWTRSLSRSPSRTSDKPRPWCPSTRLSSPSIPGIPQAGVPALSREEALLQRGRSASCTPTVNASSAKPVFSPVGSQRKFSTGAHPLRTTSPVPGFSGTRRPQLKVPPPVTTKSPTRPRQNSAPETPRIRSISPGPAAQRSPRHVSFSSSTSRHLPAGAQGTRSATSMGHRSPQESERAHQSHQRRTSLGVHPVVTVEAATPGIPGESAGLIYELGLDQAVSGSGDEMPFEEPTSPTSSSSSIGSHGRIQPSQLLQTHERQRKQQPSKKPERPDVSAKAHFEEGPITPYRPVRGDELDEEFARILNASQARMQVRRLGEGKYYFGGRFEERTPGKVIPVGGKTILCRLMEYGRAAAPEEDVGVSSGTEDASQQQQQTRRDTTAKLLRRPEPAGGRSSPRPRTKSLNSATSSASVGARSRKVMVRVGGGWQDLDLYLLEHGSYGK
ncbi:MAG: hypothetical protein J3Q66DRAFT_16415 [Benniella sp.]|nr:MAG: hypothetical protein J3Q66DRAFT_16415 [Benniella sp.]